MYTHFVQNTQIVYILTNSYYTKYNNEIIFKSSNVSTKLSKYIIVSISRKWWVSER